ncbi:MULTISPECIES: 1,2-phenylacetyl-CoA epoxidase subunit PaaC [unclassified Streptomyces]|uniref:1,2-phenylacetyl-CoA epoxidase subunit PaaC n=1 Tax=Streptomyces TaxID=1883 RepID=UPI00020E6AB1|nr:MULTISPECIES: 1,2-phenylacetyl-CoA epoxidase subunit PaaC [unclassified Streptomyces]EGJ79073.1 putative phenylacetate-CoA oxygenase, PaaI subunit [Streptomyces sp. Tu6071]MDT0423376.1 1,2-phenylacetyl-CoA epoxidase subunit PaaC [Streptomyces sp. DSM 41859]WEH26024.1 phenylacetate-CoA oxygenase subunit PaaC [Streptomyces sp. AM 3-1-1]
MSDDHLSLAADAAEGDGHWAFGTGFEDPLHGVDTTVPDGVDTAALAALCLALGDDALVSAQRLGEWVTAAPELEIELALANIGLDLLGQTRLLYARAGLLDGTGRDEDAYAYFRDADAFRNLRITEVPNGDFAFTVLRLLAHSAWRLALLRRLTSAPDPVLAAIAAKGVKELAYHRQFAADWAIRLGDGTEESHRRMTEAARALAPLLAEFGRDDSAAFLGVDAAGVAAEAREVWERVLGAATLEIPEAVAESADGRRGAHTEHLAPLLAELQVVARAHPGATW